MKSFLEFTIGCDPEVFLINTKGEFISSIGKIGGTKTDPFPIGQDCAIQEDNVAVEFNTPPCKNAADFIKAIQYNLTYLENKARDMDLGLSIVPSAIFDDGQLMTPEARRFGCEPDYNAWTHQVNPKPEVGVNAGLRSAGGHIHVGSDLAKVALIRAMDLFIGVPSIHYDKDTRRRQLYGKAGAYRPKPYGVEYRTVSNWWIKSKSNMEWVYRQVAKAVNFVATEKAINLEDGKLIQDCINKSRIDYCHMLCDKYSVE